MLIVDPFETAVTRALQDLRNSEGEDVSWRELSRRAGWSDRWGKFDNAIHGRKEQKPGGQRTGGRRVPPELIDDLAKVLPIRAEELHAAAAQTAGYDIVWRRQEIDALLGAQAHADPSSETAQILRQVRAYLDDEDVDPAERDERARTVRNLIVHGPPADVVPFPRRRYLSEAGAAAREGDADEEVSDPADNVP